MLRLLTSDAEIFFGGGIIDGGKGAVEGGERIKACEGGKLCDFLVFMLLFQPHKGAESDKAEVA